MPPDGATVAEQCGCGIHPDPEKNHAISLSGAAIMVLQAGVWGSIVPAP